MGLTHTEMRRGMWWTTWTRRGVDSKNRKTTPAATSTTPSELIPVNPHAVLTHFLDWKECRAHWEDLAKPSCHNSMQGNPCSTSI